MNAIILTEDQATQLLAARGPNDIRVLEPRRLRDGRLILNADILDDPYFADPSRSWAAILAGEQVVIADPQEVEAGAGQVEVLREGEVQAVDTFANVRSRIVTLTEAELAEPES
jgi:hypothetical protein